MAEVWIPRQLQGLTLGQAQVQVAGATVRQVIQSLEDAYPGIIHFLCDDNGLAPNMAVVVDGETSYMGLLEKVQENSEIHFLPAIGGGQAQGAPVFDRHVSGTGHTLEEQYRHLATKADIKILQEDLDSVKADIRSVKTDISLMKADINSMQDDVNSIRSDMNRFGNRFDTIDATLTLILNLLNRDEPIQQQ